MAFWFIMCTFINVKVTGLGALGLTNTLTPNFYPKTSMMLLWHVLSQLRGFPYVTNPTFFYQYVAPWVVVKRKSVRKIV